MANRTDTWNGIAQSLQGVLQPNQTYDISAWLLLAGGSSQTMPLTIAESGCQRNVVCAGSLPVPLSTNGWMQLSGQYTFNPSGTVSALNLYAEVPSSSNAAFYIDDLVVQPVNIPTNGQCTCGLDKCFSAR